jgi:hypothetical protein
MLIHGTAQVKSGNHLGLVYFSWVINVYCRRVHLRQLHMRIVTSRSPLTSPSPRLVGAYLFELLHFCGVFRDNRLGLVHRRPLSHELLARLHILRAELFHGLLDERRSGDLRKLCGDELVQCTLTLHAS